MSNFGIFIALKYQSDILFELETFGRKKTKIILLIFRAKPYAPRAEMMQLTWQRFVQPSKCSCSKNTKFGTYSKCSLPFCTSEMSNSKVRRHICSSFLVAMKYFSANMIDNLESVNVCDAENIVRIAGLLQVRFIC